MTAYTVPAPRKQKRPSSIELDYQEKKGGSGTVTAYAETPPPQPQPSNSVRRAASLGKRKESVVIFSFLLGRFRWAVDVCSRCEEEEGFPPY